MEHALQSAKELLEMREVFSLKDSPEERRWELFQPSGGGPGMILPALLPGHLFRGQNKRYRPCRSKLARYLAPGDHQIPQRSVSDQARIAELIARRLWFLKELEGHPASKWMKTRGLDRFPMPLAQHYGVPTGYIDLTESFDVACFFATCYEDPDRKWHPCTTGSGVIYMLPTAQLRFGLDMVHPIGLQPFARPRVQWGWVGVVGTNDDFERVSTLQIYEFRHDRSVSEYFLNAFGEGTHLFPLDPLAQAAETAMTSAVIPLARLDRIIEDMRADPRGLTISASEVYQALAERGITAGEAPVLFSPEQLAVLEKEWIADLNLIYETSPLRPDR